MKNKDKLMIKIGKRIGMRVTTKDNFKMGTIINGAVFPVNEVDCVLNYCVKCDDGTIKWLTEEKVVLMKEANK